MNTTASRLRFLIDLLGQAAFALRNNRRRTVLSMLGIAIGVAAVIAVSAVSRGAREFVFAELATFGLRSVWVLRDHRDKDPHRLVRPGSGIDNADLYALEVDHQRRGSAPRGSDRPSAEKADFRSRVRAETTGCCPAVRRLSPVVHDFEKRVIRTGNRYSNAEVKGVNPLFTAINNDRITSGKGLRPRDVRGRRPVAVIAPTVRDDLFGSQQSPVGRELRISGRKFTVVGLLESKSRDLLASIGSGGGEDANNRILIPYTVYQQILGKDRVSYIQAEAVSVDRAEEAARQIQTVLKRRHGESYAYTKITMASYMNTVGKILRGITLMGVVAASVSLLVGGIGIVSVMSTAVLERTREIGLRKAVGARRADILLQFLVEATAISTVGGLVGLGVGLASSQALAGLTGFSLAPTPQAIFLGVFVSMSVGVVSGYSPARRAANLPPVQALRYE